MQNKFKKVKFFVVVIFTFYIIIPILKVKDNKVLFLC